MNAVFEVPRNQSVCIGNEIISLAWWEIRERFSEELGLERCVGVLWIV